MPEQDSKSIPEVLVELKDLTVTYAKQETVEPLKDLGNFLKWGIAGALALALGLIELNLAGIRALQAETDTALTGHWSWVPYLGAVVLDVIIVVLAVLAITRKPKERR